MQKIKMPRRSKFFPRYDLDPAECVTCGKQTGEMWQESEEDEPQEILIERDRFHLPWCQLCDHRKRAIEWGDSNGFPNVHLGKYAIGPDMSCWMLAIFNGPEDLVWALIAYIEFLENGEEDLNEE